MRLRWKISKALKIPLDDPLFERLSHVQYLAYAFQIKKDAVEEDENWRDRLEYLARFWDNESVEKIQRSREQAQKGQDNVDKFDQMLKMNFGRDLGKDKS